MNNSDSKVMASIQQLEDIARHQWQKVFTTMPRLTVTTASADQWQQLISACDDVPIEYLWSVNQYHCSYYASNGISTWLPYVISIDQVPVALWPIHLVEANQEIRILSANNTILPPLFLLKAQSAKLQKRIVKLCLQWCTATANYLGLSVIQTSLNTNCHLSKTWHYEWMSLGASIECHHECVADLNLPSQEYKKRMPKGCVAAVNRSLKLWRFEVMNNMTDSQRDAFAALHFKAAGKKTRSDHSWQQQQALINSGCSFAVFVYSNKTLIGAAQFLYHQRYASYGFAAYDRSLFHLPIGHGAQSVAIDFMKEQGVTYYTLGNRCFAGEWFKPSQKEQNIGKFKAGFASHFNLKQTLTIDIRGPLIDE